MKGVLFGTGVGTHEIFGDGGSSLEEAIGLVRVTMVFFVLVFSKYVLIDATKPMA